MNSSDIKFYHSGGASNNNPELDLGGDISNFEISTSLNNLFDTLNPEDSYSGIIDYRCFYVKNINPIESFRNIKIFLNQKISGSYMEIGLDLKNEIQNIEISGTPDEDDVLELNVNGTNITTIYSSNITIWKKNFENEIRSIDGLNDVIIDYSGSVPNLNFIINFIGQASNKYFNLISVINNNLRDTSVSIVKTQNGKPINVSAESVINKFTSPSNINFLTVGFGNAITIGNLDPEESFAIWMKRTTPPKTIKKTRDNFKINIIGASS